MLIHQNHCQQLDIQDPLASFYSLFNLPEDIIYLDGNSLGAQPKSVMSTLERVIKDEWAKDLIKSWNTADWVTLPQRLGALLAPLIGAKSNEVIVCDSTSINLFKALSAAINIQKNKAPHRKRIITERTNFPTDIYIAQGLIDSLGAGYYLHLIDDLNELNDALDEDTAIVMLTQVNYRTGHLCDMKEITARAHAVGALTIWDLAHSAGALPVQLNDCHADFAIGCTYKYLNGGPGAPAFIWIATRHLDSSSNPLCGWFGHQRPFDMSSSFVPSATISKFLVGTPSVLSMSAVICGLEIFQTVHIDAIRKKSLALSDLFIQLVEQECPNLDLSLITPREHAQRGSQVSLYHTNAYEIIQALIDDNVIGDYREPGILRFGFTPLYTRYSDVWNAVQRLKNCLTARTWAQDKYKLRNAVT